MIKNKIYDTTRGRVSDEYANKIKLEPSGITLSLDAILDDCEQIMINQEEDWENPAQREDSK